MSATAASYLVSTYLGIGQPRAGQPWQPSESARWLGTLGYACGSLLSDLRDNIELASRKKAHFVGISSVLAGSLKNSFRCVTHEVPYPTYSTTKTSLCKAKRREKFVWESLSAAWRPKKLTRLLRPFLNEYQAKQSEVTAFITEDKPATLKSKFYQECSFVNTK